MRYFTLFILLFLLMACKSKNKVVNKSTNEEPLELALADTATFFKGTTVDFYSFSMKIPDGWRILNDDTIPKVTDATYRKRLHNKEKKLVYIISGLGARDVSNDLEIKANTQKVYYNKLTGFRAKYFEPIKKGQGISGMYIDSIGNIAGNNAGLCVFSENLDSLESLELMTIIRTIRVKSNAFQ